MYGRVRTEAEAITLAAALRETATSLSYRAWLTLARRHQTEPPTPAYRPVWPYPKDDDPAEHNAVSGARTTQTNETRSS